MILGVSRSYFNIYLIQALEVLQVVVSKLYIRGFHTRRHAPSILCEVIDTRCSLYFQDLPVNHRIFMATIKVMEL